MSGKSNMFLVGCFSKFKISFLAIQLEVNEPRFTRMSAVIGCSVCWLFKGSEFI